MKLVFISGPYRAPTPHGIVQNIRAAEAVALKYCRGCDKELPVDCFSLCTRDGYQSLCKKCKKAYYEKNKERTLKKQKERYEKNKPAILAKHKEYREANKDAISKRNKLKHPEYYAKNRDKILKYHKEYREANKSLLRDRVKTSMAKKPEYYRALQRKHDRLKRANPKFRVKSSMSRAIRRSLSTRKNRTWEKLVGYTLENLCAHLEKLFKPGMSWGNYGSEWHIDHKIPLAVFNFQSPRDDDFARAWALDNLQPLWAKENQRKNRKIDRPFQPSFSFWRK